MGNKTGIWLIKSRRFYKQKSIWGAIIFHILFDSINEMLIVNRSLEITLTALIIIVFFIISIYREKRIHLIKN